MSYSEYENWDRPAALRNWELRCCHANENPIVCPCRAECGCRQFHCKGKPLNAALDQALRGVKEVPPTVGWDPIFEGRACACWHSDATLCASLTRHVRGVACRCHCHRYCSLPSAKAPSRWLRTTRRATPRAAVERDRLAATLNTVKLLLENGDYMVALDELDKAIRLAGPRRRR